MRLVASLAVVCAACSGGAKSTAPAPTAPAVVTADSPTPPPQPTPKQMSLADSGIVPEWIDTSVDPCTDFFEFACGGFLKTATIPPDRSGWGAIHLAIKDSEDVLHKVLEDAAKAKSGDPVLDKIGTYYAACMDEAAIDAAGIAPIKPLLAVVDKVTDAKTAAAAVIALHREAIFPLFEVKPTQDYADATKVIADLDQAGLGLPRRNYYLENTGNIPHTRKVYVEHLERLFVLLGKDAKTAKAAAADAMRIETALARLQLSEVQRRDPHAVYHPIGRAGIIKQAPKFPWADYFAALNLATITDLNVHDPAYYVAVAKLVATERPAALRNYFTATVLRDSADDLGKAWVDEAFTLDKELHGTQQQPPRWRRCVQRVDEDLGELLGQSYVKQRFSVDAKNRAVELTKAVFGAMRAQLGELPWMDAATREQAQHKLDKMAYLIGYPDTWRLYDFAIERGAHASNVRAATRFELARLLGKIGKPVDRFDWGMTPPTVNAYYDPSLNEIALPAGQLQPPFFGATFHPAVNFGSTGGGTIGHEMTHGFDDEGSQFDADGNLRDWWSKPTKAQFATATQCVVDQYAKYEVLPKLFINGKLTSGENIADIGGVKLAYQAYHAWKAQQPTPPQSKIGAYTDDQLYFMAYAQSWCMKRTPALDEQKTLSDPHSPPRFRTNGVIVNQPGFGPAFQCAAGAPMNPTNKCSVW